MYLSNFTSISVNLFVSLHILVYSHLSILAHSAVAVENFFASLQRPPTNEFPETETSDSQAPVLELSGVWCTPYFAISPTSSLTRIVRSHQCVK